jgi:hypothetical protein
LKEPNPVGQKSQTDEPGKEIILFNKKYKTLNKN